MKLTFAATASAAALLAACAGLPTSTTMQDTQRTQAVALLESLETGDTAPIASINPNKYIQHNLAVGDGLAGFGEVVKNAPPGGFKAKVVRAFADGDYAFTHTEYDFFGPKVGFDIFRFEDGLIVEHWDNLADVAPPNPSGRTQTDGSTEATDLGKTEENKALVREFVEAVLMGGDFGRVTEFVSAEEYLQHNVAVADGLDGLGEAMAAMQAAGLVMRYERLHMVLGEGDFVLSVSEGRFGKDEHSALYDLFRVEDGKIVEHWDVIQGIPPRGEWRNGNGKF